MSKIAWGVLAMVVYALGWVCFLALLTLPTLGWQGLWPF